MNNFLALGAFVACAWVASNVVLLEQLDQLPRDRRQSPHRRLLLSPSPIAMSWKRAEHRFLSFEPCGLRLLR